MRDKSKVQLVKELKKLQQQYRDLLSRLPETLPESASGLGEERFALATRAGKVGVWEWKVETDEIYISPGLKAILGYQDHEIANKLDEWLELVHPDDKEAVMEAARAHLDGLTPLYEIEHRMIHKNGEIRWILARGIVRRDAKGKPTLMTGTDTDVTDRRLALDAQLRAREAEAKAQAIEAINLKLQKEIAERERIDKALRATEERYRSLYEATPSMYFTVDSKGTILFTNQFGADQLGYTKQELIGQPILKFLHNDDKKAFTTQLSNCVQNPERIHKGEFRKIKKDGTLLWVKEVARTIDDKNGKAVHLILCEDITEIKKAEEERHHLESQLLQAQKLESLGVLAGGIAHDFNNLLTGILGNASLALMDLPADSPATECIMQIEKSAARAAERTSQLLAYAGKGKYDIQEIHLSDFIKEMEPLLEMTVPKNITVTYKLDPSTPVFMADNMQIRQVIMNMVANASEAIGEDTGTIAIKTGSQRIENGYFPGEFLDYELTRGLYVYLQVTDDGCGLDIKTQQKIFDPFFSTKFIGRGLGLSAVLGIVRSHRGAIEVQSQPGQGATFRVLFPSQQITQKIGDDLQAISDRAKAAKSQKILIIEDEDIARSVAERILTKFGFHVLVAQDGVEGIRIFEKHSNEIGAVLLDITMPRLSGEETFRQLRNIKPNIHILLSSGYDEKRAITRFDATQIAGFIQKPYQPNALIQKFLEILGA